MPGARLLGPAIGKLHLFFHRLGPVLSKRLLLTGEVMPVADLPRTDIFTEIVPEERVAARAEEYTAQIDRVPIDDPFDPLVPTPSVRALGLDYAFGTPRRQALTISESLSEEIA